MLDARGVLQSTRNERAGRFQARPGPEGLGTLVALAVADLNSDGNIDLAGVATDGTVAPRSRTGTTGHAWEVVDVARAPAAVGDAARLFVADLDNNGALDLIGSGSSGGWIGLGDETGGFRTSAAPAGPAVSSPSRT